MELILLLMLEDVDDGKYEKSGEMQGVNEEFKQLKQIGCIHLNHLHNPDGRGCVREESCIWRGILAHVMPSLLIVPGRAGFMQAK